MSNSKFSDDFKHDAVHQITKRGYSVADVSRRLDVSTHSLYAWVKRYYKTTTNPSGESQSAEVRRLKLELVLSRFSSESVTRLSCFLFEYDRAYSS